MNIWERQPSETAKAFSAFCHYRDLPPVDRSVAAAWGRKIGGKQWERWCAAHDWVNRAAEHDSDLASRRRERMAQELERAQDDAVVLIKAALGKVKERIKGMDAEELAAGQTPAALRTLIELEFKALGYEDRVALTGKDGGPVKTEHAVQPAETVGSYSVTNETPIGPPASLFLLLRLGLSSLALGRWPRPSGRSLVDAL